MSILLENEMGETRTLDAPTNHGNNGSVTPYYSQEVAARLTPQELAAITSDWDKTNARRCDLIEKEIGRQITLEEQQELDYLQHLTDARIDLLTPPLPIAQLEAFLQDLKRKGMREAQ